MGNAFGLTDIKHVDVPVFWKLPSSRCRLFPKVRSKTILTDEYFNVIRRGYETVDYITHPKAFDVKPIQVDIKFHNGYLATFDDCVGFLWSVTLLMVDKQRLKFFWVRCWVAVTDTACFVEPRHIAVANIPAAQAAAAAAAESATAEAAA